MASTPRLFRPDSLIPLAGVDPDSSYDDLAILSSVTKTAKIVALGEPTHGQREINQLRDKITRYLIEHMGFRVVAMEDSAIQCRIVNDFVVHGNGTAMEALASQNFWTWKTREVLAMIEWLRSWNIQHPDDPVEFIGIDIQDFSAPALKLLGLFSKIGAGHDAVTVRILEQISRLQMWDPSPFDEREFQTFLSTIQEIQKMILSSTALSSDNLDLAKDCARSLTESFNMLLALANSPSHESAERWNSRDEVMARRTSAPVNRARKVILWAHNGHIQSEKPGGIPHGAKSMGQRLRETWGDRYVVISGIFGSGAYLARNPSDGTFGTRDVGEPPVGSIDHVLWSSSNSPSLLVDISVPEGPLSESQTTRWAGAALVSSDEMVANVRPAVGSNMLAFVRDATPSVRIENLQKH